MARNGWRSEWRGVAAKAERELKAAIEYTNDRIVPRVRVEAAGALHAAGEGLVRLAGMLGRPAAGGVHK